MKKTLLIAAAALAAGVISSQAQVYSQNIVGYVNVPLPMGYSTVSVPLNGSNGNNALTNTIDNSSGALNGCYLYTFTGTHFNVVTFDNGFATGFGDAADLNPVPTPVIAPGTGFIINNNSGVPITNTFVGTVAISSVPGAVTNIVGANKSFVSSVLPIGGGLISSLQFTNINGNLNGAYIYVPNIVGGNVHGYTISTFDNGFPSGFGDAADLNPAPEPNIPVGSGFIIDNNAGLGAVNWVQGL
jgi:hypothetical protein